MIVEAMCIADAFDNGVKGVTEPRRYYRGPVPDFDTNNQRLNSLTDHRGNWIFQYPGHQGVSAQWVEQNRKAAKTRGVTEEEEELAAEPAPANSKPKRVISPELKAKMKSAREAARARKSQTQAVA